MFAGLIAVLIRGSMDQGGFGNIWRLMEEGQRIEFFKSVCNGPWGIWGRVRDSSSSESIAGLEVVNGRVDSIFRDGA